MSRHMSWDKVPLPNSDLNYRYDQGGRTMVSQYINDSALESSTIFVTDSSLGPWGNLRLSCSDCSTDIYFISMCVCLSQFDQIEC